MDAKQLHDAVQRCGGIRAAGRELGIPESTIRRKLKDFTPDLPDHAFVPDPEEMTPPHVAGTGVETIDYWGRQEKAGGVRRYIITSAQNNVPVHTGFLRNLEALAAATEAEILISYSLYDKQGYRGAVHKGEARIGKRDIWWDKAIRPYTKNVRCRLAKRLAFCGELDILASTSKPLSGLDAYCGRSSIIVPHNKFAFHCVESRPHQMPKEMYTTGSVTTSRFIQRKTGQVAHFHHVVGALLVEVAENGSWYAHHLNAEDDGSFYWLDYRVRNGRVAVNKDGISALILGDIHHEKLEGDQSVTVFDLVRWYRPRNVVVHDLIDFTSRNHHNRHDPIFRVRVGGTSVETELQGAATWLAHLQQVSAGEVVVAKSNHDEALTRWIKETDWRSDPVNAPFYLRLAYQMVTLPDADPLEWSLQKLGPRAVPPPKLKPVRFLRQDESYEVEGIECGIHGHVGPSGTRGSPAKYARLGFKTFTGHTHSPSIIDGCYTVGVAGSLDMGYNKGPSKWMHCHGIIYPNGKRAFVFIKNGKWKA